MRHAYARAKALPADLVEAQAKANSDCEKVWRVARQQRRFRHGQAASGRGPAADPRSRRRAVAQRWACQPYDALMDGYQQGIGADDVAPIFAAYEDFLADALPAGGARQARQPAADPARRAVSRSRRSRRCAAISPQRLGLDFDHARLDQSAHPFSGGTPTDVRITTRYVEDGFRPGDPRRRA